jgi:hypothetical protein
MSALDDIVPAWRILADVAAQKLDTDVVRVSNPAAQTVARDNDKACERYHRRVAATTKSKAAIAKTAALLRKTAGARAVPERTAATTLESGAVAVAGLTAAGIRTWVQLREISEARLGLGREHVRQLHAHWTSSKRARDRNIQLVHRQLDADKLAPLNIQQLARSSIVPSSMDGGRADIHALVRHGTVGKLRDALGGEELDASALERALKAEGMAQAEVEAMTEAAAKRELAIETQWAADRRHVVSSLEQRPCKWHDPDVTDTLSAYCSNWDALTLKVDSALRSLHGWAEAAALPHPESSARLTAAHIALEEYARNARRALVAGFHYTAYA